MSAAMITEPQEAPLLGREHGRRSGPGPSFQAGLFQLLRPQAPGFVALSPQHHVLSLDAPSCQHRPGLLSRERAAEGPGPTTQPWRFTHTRAEPGASRASQATLRYEPRASSLSRQD